MKRKTAIELFYSDNESENKEELEKKLHHVVSALPKSYTCPYCHYRVYLGRWSEYSFKECGVILHSCEYCGCVSTWETHERFSKRTKGDCENGKKEKKFHR